MARRISWFECAEKVVNRINAAFPNPEFGKLGLVRRISVISAAIAVKSLSFLT